MANRIQARVDTAANWTTANSLLLAGEWAYESDTGNLKLGDGSTLWNSLPYYTGGAGAVVSVAGKTGVVTLVNADVGLGNVDNTSDVNKPVSTAQAVADAAVLASAIQRANHTGTQVASTISDFTAAADARVSAGISSHVGLADPHPNYALDADVTAAQAYAVQRSNHTGTQAAGTITGLAAVATSGSKSDVGLGNVDNTSDVNKPVSTAQAVADAAVLASAIQRANHTGTQVASTISDFAATVRSTVLTGLSLASSATIAATDTILAALGQLQAQVTNRVLKAGDTMSGALSFSDVNGNGYVDFIAQSTTPGTPASGVRLYSGATGRLAWKGTTGNAAALDATAITGTRIYTLPDASGTLLFDAMTTIGDLIFRNGSNATTRLPVGTTDQRLGISGGIPAWVDQNFLVLFGSKSLGSATISGVTTLTQNAFYDTLTLNAGGVINLGGYSLYARKIVVTSADASAFRRIGNNGSNATSATGAAAGAALAAAVHGLGDAASAGGTGTTGAGAQAAAPGTTTPSNGGAGGQGSAGGTGSGGAGGALRAGGGVTNPVSFEYLTHTFLRGIALMAGGAGGAGGGAGGGDGTITGAGGGGGGGGGGVAGVYCLELETGVSTPAGVFSCKGGNGGNGFTRITGTNMGGGGGAGGGGGGYFYLAYMKKTGAAVTNLITASGGNGGNGGNGLGTGIGGNGGSGGDGGDIQIVNVLTGVSTLVVGSAGSAGTTGSGITGGLGGSGGVCQATL